jgi:cell division protein FtsW
MKRPGVPARSFAFALMLVIVAGLLLQPDIGQTALVLATWGALLFLSGISWIVIFGLGAAAVGLLFGAYVFFPHFARRIDTFLNPEGGGNR